MLFGLQQSTKKDKENKNILSMEIGGEEKEK